ncbi:phage virion morphogenesis protein [Ottowia pentelensis]|uniref:phage virion morphogenesis protein n=1 Tax=Ottowia pentelensis TaxID=511108 RepID=UPI00362B2835
MITIEVKDRQVLDMLNRLMRGMADTTPVMADVAAGLLSQSERQFATESGPFGPWPDLSDTTKALRTERGTLPGKMLQASGALAASVQAAHGNGWASIGSNKPYAAMQFFGGTTSSTSMIPGKAIPARPFLPFHPETHELTPKPRRLSSTS